MKYRVEARGAPKKQPRWYAPTPAKFLFAVLVMQVVLFLSAHYRWAWFNERKGYTVLIAVAATLGALLLLVVAVALSRFFKWKSQFGLATLLLMIPVMGVPCAWLAREMELARQQRLIVVEATYEDRHVTYLGDYDDPFARSDLDSSVYRWLGPYLGQDFFDDIKEIGDVVLYAKFSRRTDDELLKWVKTQPGPVDDINDSQCTALYWAACYGRTETAKWLIAQGANVNTQCLGGRSPMHVVKDQATAQLLISAGADLTRKDSGNKTPLQIAAHEGHTVVCEAILSTGFPLDFLSAVCLGKGDFVRRMIEENPSLATDVSEESSLWGNMSPLGEAAYRGDKEIVALLLEAGAPVNAVTHNPRMGEVTALCNAVWVGEFEVAEMLCIAGADCNKTGGKFYPRLLDFALKNSDQKMIDLLIKHGAKTSEIDVVD